MHLSLEEIQKLQGADSRKANQEKIIANDFAAAFRVLKEAQRSGKKDRRVDIVLDNAGFELYVDLVLTGYLLESGLATHVVLHPKNIPWFVSDVVPRDFADTLNVLQNAKAFYETPSDDERTKGTSPVKITAEEEKSFDGVFAHWSSLYAEGKITLRPNEFWTHAGSYWRMPATAPAIVEDLKESELVIFKGDLNYRKLTGDVSLPIILELHEWQDDKADIVNTGFLGSYHSLPRSHRTSWTWLGPTHSLVPYCQGRRCCRPAEGQRRGA
jgi:hypothetical protein